MGAPYSGLGESGKASWRRWYREDRSGECAGSCGIDWRSAQCSGLVWLGGESKGDVKDEESFFPGITEE